jgi:hypothetical protein
MKLTIDNLDGLGETDYTARLDAEAPPKIVRKLNQAPLLTARLACEGVGITAAAGSKVRLYRDTGDLWFSGYMDEAPQREFAGMLMGTAVFRVALHAKGEMGALDRGVLSERAAMGGRTAGQAVTVLTQEANSAFTTAAVQDVALSASYAVETGELWSAATAGIADCARATLSVQSRALTMAPVGLATRTLTDGDAGFSPDSLNLSLGGATANDITVIGSQEPALYVRDHFTATGSEVTLALTQDAFKAKRSVLVEDDFHTMALDMTKWKNDFPGPLTFTQGGVACAGPVALRYRDRVEVGGLIILEQTGISYTNGQGIVGGLFCGGVGPNYCIAGVMLENGQVQPVIGGVVNAAVKQLTAGMLYEFRTLIFHPEPIRAGQVYSSSVCNPYCDDDAGDQSRGPVNIEFAAGCDFRLHDGERSSLRGLPSAVGVEPDLHTGPRGSHQRRRGLGAVRSARAGVAHTGDGRCFSRSGVLRNRERTSLHGCKRAGVERTD